MPWMRVEPHRRTTDIKVGLAAEIADPLWLLLRQWQFGELTGDDGGSAVAVDIAASWTRFNRYRPEGGVSTEIPQGEAVAYDPDGEPLETRVEREPTIRLAAPEATPWNVAVRAGRLLADALVAAGLDATATALARHPATTFAPPDRESSRAEGRVEARYRAMLAGAGGGRVIDGAKVLSLHRSDSLPADLGLAGHEDLLDAWAEELDREWGVSTSESGSSPAWIRDRCEYAFSVAAPALPGVDAKEIVLRAEQYDGTGMHWSTVDLDPDEALGAIGAAEGRMSTVLPSPLTFPGMAADRYWEMEDAAVALGTTSLGRTDLARMLATEFAVIYSPDWYLAPVEIPVGSVARIDWVIVRDTFGTATLVGTADWQEHDGAGRQFQPDVVGGDADKPLLVVLPSMMGSLTSAPIEEVALQRDEMANLAWAIEQTVMGPSGRPVPRPWFASSFEPPKAVSADAELIWRLATPVADTWTPLVPVIEDPEAGGQAQDGLRFLRRASILETTDARLNATKSVMLSETSDFREEEITSAGIQLRMVDQLARSHDGSVLVWRGREKRVWRGEASSRLRFDDAQPPVLKNG